jgi:GNAT superfamily N-acetyltransferase
MSDTYRVRPAVADDKIAIIGLIDSAATWLQRDKNTNQWAEPWPDEETRNGRITRGIVRGATWIVEDRGVLAGTITCRDRANPRLWTPAELAERAVYVSRLIVDRPYAGHGLGAALIDWAGVRGMEQWDADWLRVDVWTTNLGLHNYYKGQDFEYLRTVETECEWDYPSAVLFQKPTAAVNRASAALFEQAGGELSGTVNLADGALTPLR